MPDFTRYPSKGGDPLEPPPDFTRYPDLASRDLAGSVIGANDELLARDRT